MASLDYQPGHQLPGTVYKILRLIGVGGMGTVYDVEDTTIGKRYVIKTLHPKLGAREDLARRVLKEARTLARLNHPNIVEVITAGVTADDLKLPYYVMERLNGQSLRVVLDKKGRLELSHAYHIGIDLLDALDHAHDKGLIHRDVKPDNIFLHRTVSGVTVTKLLDFGIVSVLEAGTSETAGRFLGTLRYAAPEQLRGESPTPKMDVYAAALVIYEIIAGRGPFDDQGDSSAVGAAHLNKLAPRVSQFVPVPKELDNLLSAALAKDPRMRPRDAFSFAASLRNLNRLHEVTERRDTTDSRATAAGVMGLVTESSPLPSAAAAVASTARGSQPPSRSPPPGSPSQTGLPKTTLVGMAPPTVGPAPAATTTAPDAFDRTAPTRSIDTDLARVPSHGTEALEARPAEPEPPREPSDVAGLAELAGAAGDLATAPTVPSGPPAEAVADTIEWPREQAAVRSEEPQIRSLPAPPLPAGRRALVAAGAGAALLLLLAAVLVVRLVRHRGASAGDTELPASAPARAPRPVEPEIVPAPYLAPPAFDLGELPDTRPRTDPKALRGVASAPPAAGAPPSPLAAAVASSPPAQVKASPAAAPAKPQGKPPSPADRPGPGF
jgi:serine/threonine protein kinase